MRNVLLIISLLVSLNSFGYEDIVKEQWKPIMKRQVTNNFHDFCTILKYFQGETIQFKFRNLYYNDLQCFLNLKPDTVWIKKPKKNPKINKDYTLMPYYHGKGEYNEKAFIDKDKRYTPREIIANTTFHVDSVSEVWKQPCYIYLTNLQNNEKLIWAFSNKWGSSMTFESQSIGEKIVAPQTPIYMKTGNSYFSKPQSYEILKVEKAVLECEFSDLSYSPTLEILLKDDSGSSFSYKYDSFDYSYSNSPKYITQTDYNILLEENKDFELDPTTDFNVAKYTFPFNFVQIWGETITSGYVYQKISGKNSYSDIKDYLGSENTVRIADKRTIRGKDYYVATCYGKCFFIPTENLSIKAEEQAKLDSLMNCSQEVKDKFFELTKGFELYQYVQDTKVLLKEFDTFKKYGLSIVNWKVYDESEYTDGTGIRFTFYNPTNSMIKYITITFTGYNAVDDPVGRAVTKKCIGPINPDASASYKFEYTWFTDIVEYAKIRSIKVDYKNGTSKTITNIGAIEWSDDLYDYFQNPPLKDLTTLKTKGEPTE